MKQWFWRNGRFGWPLVTAIVLATLVMLVTDLAWRMLVIPAEGLAAVATGMCITAVLIFVGLCHVARRRKPS